MIIMGGDPKDSYKPESVPIGQKIYTVASYIMSGGILCCAAAGLTRLFGGPEAANVAEIMLGVGGVTTLGGLAISYMNAVNHENRVRIEIERDTKNSSLDDIVDD